uniref:Uncharacterized protein AlNc14C440G11663 n=1 Tax=Albugo laibachii Nc14 TaxID=890382 RepID=F0WZS2_9STRA|nr:conserved hypothetical protein [Albugo laibachii Nc14]|eukprot:CCA26999.1 conserved hypothetical protein [Albugo laibachii Nc14]
MSEGRWDDLLTESEDLCAEKRYKSANEKVLLVLNEMTVIYGENAPDLVNCYLHLAEIMLKQNQLNETEETLSLIKWILIKESGNLDQELILSHNARMEKLYCLMMIRHRSFERALNHASRGAYFCSLLLGPDHIETSQFYFQIGSILNNETWQSAESSCLNPNSKGSGMLNKVVDIWYQVLNDKMLNSSLLSFSQSKLQEGARMLELIAEFQLKQNGRTQPPDGKILHTRGLISIELGLQTEALKFIKCAHDVYSKALGTDNPVTKDAQKSLYWVEENLPNSKLN